jgi:hypothetical protein
VYKYRRSSIEYGFAATLEQSDIDEFKKMGGQLAIEILDLVTSYEYESQPGITEMILITGTTFYIAGANTISRPNYHFFVIDRKIWLVVIDNENDIHVFVSPADDKLVSEILSERNKKNIIERKVEIDKSGTPTSIHVYTRAIISIQYTESGYTIWSDVYRYSRSSINRSFSATLEQSDITEFNGKGGLLANEILQLKSP